MVLVSNSIFLVLFLISNLCTAIAEPRLPSSLAHGTNPQRSSLPVVVTAKTSSSTDASEPTVAGTSHLVTTTNVILTTTTVFTTIFGGLKTSTFSPTNALQVLSAAERSFSLENARSDLPHVVTATPGAVSTTLQRLSLHASASNLPALDFQSPPESQHRPLGASFGISSMGTDYLTTISVNRASLVTSSDGRIASNSNSSTVMYLSSASHTQLANDELVTMRPTVQDQAVPSMSTNTAVSTSRAISTMLSSGGPSARKASYFKMAAAAIGAISLVFGQR